MFCLQTYSNTYSNTNNAIWNKWRKWHKLNDTTHHPPNNKENLKKELFINGFLLRFRCLSLFWVGCVCVVCKLYTTKHERTTPHNNITKQVIQTTKERTTSNDISDTAYPRHKWNPTPPPKQHYRKFWGGVCFVGFVCKHITPTPQQPPTTTFKRTFFKCCLCRFMWRCLLYVVVYLVDCITCFFGCFMFRYVTYFVCFVICLQTKHNTSTHETLKEK